MRSSIVPDAKETELMIEKIEENNLLVRLQKKCAYVGDSPFATFKKSVSNLKARSKKSAHGSCAPEQR